MKIWKWSLALKRQEILLMPKGAKLLAVQTQRNMPHLWALVDENLELEPRAFATYETGDPLPENKPGKYVGTYQLENGQLVFHFFELEQSMSDQQTWIGIDQEHAVLLGLLTDCAAVLRTIDPDDSDEAERLADLLDAIDRAQAPSRHQGALL